ncbi:MAG: hypothetical protein FWE01_03145 [Firmicutes bacterium]|nr:hypothetical protein [Bacillota bacterium]
MKNEKFKELLNKIQEKNIPTHFDSTGMHQLQVMTYLLEESQKIINDLGIELEFANEIQEIVKYKTPFNIIKQILRHIWWTDSAGVYDYMKVLSSEQLTVQELVELLKNCDPNALVVLGDLCTAAPLKYEPTEMYMFKDQSTNKVLFEDDFHQSIADKMQPVVVIDAPSKQSEQKEKERTTSYTKFFSSSKGNSQEMIKWLFERTQANIAENNKDINIMPQLKKAKNLETALEILDNHVKWVDVDKVA